MRDVPERNTDEHLVLQYAAAWSFFTPSASENEFRLLAARQSVQLPVGDTLSPERQRHPDHLEALTDAALNARGQSRSDLAERFLRRHLEIDDGRPLAHFLLAEILEDKGEVEDAEIHFARAEKLDPLMIVVRAKRFMGRQQYSRALSQFDKARQEIPMSPTVHRETARAYVAVERRDDAIKSYRRALEIDPIDRESQRELAALEQENPGPSSR